MDTKSQTLAILFHIESASKNKTSKVAVSKHDSTPKYNRIE